MMNPDSATSRRSLVTSNNGSNSNVAAADNMRTPVGMHRMSSQNFRGEVDYGDAALNEGEEYISTKERRHRLNLICGSFGGKCVLVLVGAMLFIMIIMVGFTRMQGYSSSSNTNGADGETDGVQLDLKRSQDIANQIIAAGLATDQTLLEQEGTAQYKALYWISHMDPSKLKVSDDYLVQRYALATFYYSTTVDKDNSTATVEWDNNENWLSGDGYCNWRGISCIPPADQPVDPENPLQFNSNGQVLSIVLEDNDLEGTVPSELAAFPMLDNLDLSKNKMHGTLPKQLATMTSLRSISFRDNAISGKIMSEFGGMTDLRNLHLGQNSMTGKIPNAVDKMISLRGLALNSNKFSGSIPDLQQLKRCSKLYLDRNSFTGNFPLGLTKMTGLVELRLGNNELAGTVPSAMEDLTKLQSLRMERNKLNGVFPGVMFAKVSRLTELWLSYNEFEGDIPDEVEYLGDMVDFRMDHNKLTGTFPLFISLMADLTTLHLDNNQLTGSFPSNLPSMVDLLSLFVNHNQMTGGVPSGLGRLYKLEHIHLEENELDGPIPTNLGLLSSLKTLRLNGNADLSGSMPSQVCDLVSEEVLAALWVNCKSKTGKVECACCTKCF